MILKEKAKRWNEDKEIQTILKEISAGTSGAPDLGHFSKKAATALLSRVFDRDMILKKRLPYERLDQLTIDVLTGVR